jgi:hypothetical protein
MDVAWRVLPLRGYAIKRSFEVLLCHVEGINSSRDGDGYILPEVLPEAAWIVGEHSHLIPEALVGGNDGDDEALLAIQSKLVIPVQRHSSDGLTYLVGELVR